MGKTKPQEGFRRGDLKTWLSIAVNIYIYIYTYGNP